MQDDLKHLADMLADRSIFLTVNGDAGMWWVALHGSRNKVFDLHGALVNLRSQADIKTP